jgi:protocatechuate 3,4-dioxygenase beta subunit
MALAWKKRESIMDNDDILVGRLLSRREAVRLIGASGAAALFPWELAARQGSAPLPCVVRPEMTEGPFFVDGSLVRSDIRTDTSSRSTREGEPLTLAFHVSQITSGQCGPLPNAIVHVWQCDAVGVYSGVRGPGAGSNPNDNALRGTQITGKTGVVRFTTIYPGWYRGRAVHVHFKIRTSATGQAFEYTSQLFFPEALNDKVHSQGPYASHGRRDTPNARDGIYRGGGDQLLLDPKPASGGYEAAVDIALDLTDTRVGAPDGGGMRGRGRRGGIL